MNEEEELKDFFKIHTHLQDHYVIAETIEEAIAKFRKIASDEQIEAVTFMGYLHE